MLNRKYLYAQKVQNKQKSYIQFKTIIEVLYDVILSGNENLKYLVRNNFLDLLNRYKIN